MGRTNVLQTDRQRHFWQESAEFLCTKDTKKLICVWQKETKQNQQTSSIPRVPNTLCEKVFGHPKHTEKAPPHEV